MVWGHLRSITTYLSEKGFFGVKSVSRDLNTAQSSSTQVMSTKWVLLKNSEQRRLPFPTFVPSFPLCLLYPDCLNPRGYCYTVVPFLKDPLTPSVKQDHRRRLPIPPLEPQHPHSSESLQGFCVLHKCPLVI